MQKITPFLWFDSQAEEAMEFYTGIFDDSRIVNISRYPDRDLEGPMQGMQGKVITGEFELAGQRFLALDGGPNFKFTPSISFFVNCETAAEVDALWEQLSDGGSVAMPLDTYPFSERFGWLEDRYGVSWQLNVGARAQKITPFLMFVGDLNGKAEEAIRTYTSIFRNSGIENILHHGADGSEQEGTVMHAVFQLAGQDFMAMENDGDHPFSFTGAISFYVECESQDEVDYFWEKLSAVPQAEQCGWLADQYGISWQIVPTVLPELLNDPDPEKSRRAMDAMLQMKKIDIAALQAAHAGVHAG
jgi:predicted 3-demethylubiquinone-9 3-methyltransferase (glyoxalase superfamily)